MNLRNAYPVVCIAAIAAALLALHAPAQAKEPAMTSGLSACAAR